MSSAPTPFQHGRSLKISLAFLTKNELPGLRAVFPAVQLSVVDQVFAVDGSSSDGTVEFFRERGIPVHQQRERGLGAAMLEARAHTTTDALIYFHPDGNEDPADIPKFIERLNAGSEFVVASRMITGGRNEEDVSLWRPRKWANRGLGLIANTLFSRNGVRTTDITNGFRAITCATFDRMCLSARDLTMDFQMIIRALKLGIPIDEFPTREGERIGGQTNFSSFATGLKEVELIWTELLQGHAVFKGTSRHSAGHTP
jgi:glycosyltransferase involved in cell wall biosynthesis